ncbi:MAG: DUF3105 domain-containing protein [Labilithrix sp.]|nr:DUF3105 domain-containing protein [Labilithrix sp.]MCW5812314.1 DUF3105 domain-containing protein [Labilithrix sp.]
MKSCLALALSVIALIAACSSDSDDNSGTTSSSTSGAPPDADAGPAVCSADPTPPDVRNASCAVTINTHALQEPANKHVQVGTAVDYCTNPPSSGPHYFAWTSFGEFTQPVEWQYLVHSEEHGAVLLLYKCDPACPEIVEQLREVKTRAPNDCGGNKRIIIAPAPSIPTKVAAAAWGKTLTADCVDGPTFDEFVANNIAKGPEDICVPGQVFP